MPHTVVTAKRKWIRFTKRMVVMAAIVYLFLCALIYFAQDWIAFPGTAEQASADTAIHYPRAVETPHLLTRNGIPITAVFASAPEPNRPTILYFYGNAGSVAWSQGEFDHFHALDCNVLIPDLPGYGASGGKASETNFNAAADAAWDYLQTRPGIDPTKIVVVGWSMGSAIAIDLASRKPIFGLAIFNAFTTLPAMAHAMFPWAPTNLLLKYQFDNQSKIARIHCPMLICNGKLDTLIPPVMSDHLAAVAGGPVTRLVIATADHNSIFIAEPNVLWPALGKWIAALNALSDRLNHHHNG